MRVRELIEALGKMPLDGNVYFEDEYELLRTINYAHVDDDDDTVLSNSKIEE